MRLLGYYTIILFPIQIYAQCNPPQVKKSVLATVEGSLATVKILDAQPDERYHLYRTSFSSNSFEKIATITSSQFSDTEVDPSAGSYCYYVKTENNCGQISEPSNSVCTIYLKGRGRTLQWNSPFPSHSNVIQYKVSKIDSPPTDVSDSQYAERFTLSSQSKPNDTYRVTASITIEVNGHIVSTELYSSLYELIDLPGIYPPDVFTPNNDNINDTWVISSYLIQTFQLKLFDRSGVEIFVSDSLSNSWNGQLPDGSQAPSQVYSYVINATDFFNEQWQQTGKVLLLK